MNAEALLAGRTDTPLTETGKAQALAAGVEAKELSIDLIIASPLDRAHTTANIIAEQIGYPLDSIILDERLMERDFGEAEGAPWVFGMDISDTPGLEPIEDLHKRVAEVLDFAKSRPETIVLIVAHGAVYRMFHELTSTDYTFDNIALKSKNAEIIKLI